MMTVEPAVLPDAELLAGLEADCFSEPWSKQSLETSLRDEKFCVLAARADGSICGYVLGWNVGDEGELARIAVFQSFRGQGIGEMLVQAFIEELTQRGGRSIFLEVRRDNETANRIYRRCGFEEVGCRPKYYADGEDAVLMCRSL